MDDCVIVHHDRVFLSECLDAMREHIERDRLLSFNRKTHIVPMSQGIDYLGFRSYLTDTGKVIRRLRTSNKKRMKRKMKFFSKAHAKGHVELDAISRSLASYKGHLKHGHCWNLRKYMIDGIWFKRE